MSNAYGSAIFLVLSLAGPASAQDRVRSDTDIRIQRYDGHATVGRVVAVDSATIFFRDAEGTHAAIERREIRRIERRVTNALPASLAVGALGLFAGAAIGRQPYMYECTCRDRSWPQARGAMLGV